LSPFVPLFDFKVLDPAMGSGHFLVEAVDQITDKLLQFLNAFPVNPVSFALERTRSSILESLSTQGITVLRDKLTDINLLKRHVLKRCIYGVDLNPMAVELAKVSLWLDAFTLGAPLSFLDHHLRCGNSLVGATLADLEAATSGRLFGLDYGPLLEAIKFVLFVSKVADATAAEVADSISRYGQAREALSGYQIVLDLMLAEHFGMAEAKALVSSGSDLDLSDRDRFLCSLRGDEERKLVAQVEGLAHRPDLRFFHWEIEFPEVFTGFFDPNQTNIMHKDRIKQGTAGFDVVIGNPPYVRQETIKPIKTFLKARYSTFDSTNDLYVYFQEMEIRNLRVHGRMGMIVANKWMRAGYGEQLRDFLLRTGQPLEVIDFGHAPIFPDADTFPCILLMTKRPKALSEKETPPESEMVAACQVPREHWHDRMDLGGFVAGRRHPVPTRLLRKEGWSLDNPSIQDLLEKIRRTGQPLKEYCGSPVYGVKTGCNEAFIVDEALYQRLLVEDRNSQEIVRPLLRGRDIDRWRAHTSGVYMVVARRGLDIDRYPAVKRHLQQFKGRLEPKPRIWSASDGEWLGRATGDYKWYELQASPGDDGMAVFNSPKIVWQDLAFHSRFCLEPNGTMINDLCFGLATPDKFLLAVLNAPVMWWFMARVVIHGKDEVLRLKGIYTENFPIPTPSDERRGQIVKLTDHIISVAQDRDEVEQEFIEAVKGRFSCQEFDRRVVDWLLLSSDVFTQRLFKTVRMRSPNQELETEVRTLYEKHRIRWVEILTRQLELEKILAALVEDAYSLTPEERELLRSTRPVRDPLDVLEAKIRGAGALDHSGKDEE